MTIALILLSAALVAALIYIVILQGRSARLSEKARFAEKALQEQKEFFDSTNRAAEERFRALAQTSLSQNAEVLRQQNRRGLQEVLEPMKEDLERFRQQVNEAYSREGRERYALGQNLQNLTQLSETIGEETRRLTEALKGNTGMQGRWGEMILENILQAAGLRKGEDYSVQVAKTNAEGQMLRPDVIVNCPDGLKIVIDSKVSIQDYIRMQEADDEASRRIYARAHVDSVRKHVGELVNKSYQSLPGCGAIDYVLMFIPHEGAYIAAMTIDPDLWTRAFEKGVVIVSAAHLMSVVKLVEQMWRHDRQNRNAIAIADQAGRLLDKFNGFISDLSAVGARISAASDAWAEAEKKLYRGKGNLVGMASSLASMGAKSKKPLPKAEEEAEEVEED